MSYLHKIVHKEKIELYKNYTFRSQYFNSLGPIFFLDASQEEKTIGYIFALLFSFYGSYFLKEGRDNKRWNIFEVFLLMLFPLLYLLEFLLLRIAGASTAYLILCLVVWLFYFLGYN